MRSIFLSLLLLPVWVAAQTAPFEGVITYAVSYQTPGNSGGADQLALLMGSEWRYAIKRGRYRTDSNGKMFETQLYRAEQNRLYSKYAQASAWYWEDGAETEDSIRAITRRDSVTTVLGRVCHELTIETTQAIMRYYYPADRSLQIDTSAYRAHRYGQFATYVREAGVSTLRAEMVRKEYTIRMEALAVTPQALPDSLFELPDLAQVEPMPKLR